MLRTLRVVAILVFALLVGLSTNTLRKMYEDGQLMERYNSARKANLTLFSFSLAALAALGYFELIRGKRTAARRDYRTKTSEESKKSMDNDLNSSCIYSAPKTLEAWQGRRTSSSRSRHKQPLEMAGLWMGLLRIFCFGLPLLYCGMLIRSLISIESDEPFAWLLPAIFLGLTLFSFATTMGLWSKKTWGLILGYILAVFNLLIFPWGTAVGLVLLMGLVGATPEFTASVSERRRMTRKKAARKLHVESI